MTPVRPRCDPIGTPAQPHYSTQPLPSCTHWIPRCNGCSLQLSQVQLGLTAVTSADTAVLTVGWRALSSPCAACHGSAPCIHADTPVPAPADPAARAPEQPAWVGLPTANGGESNQEEKEEGQRGLQLASILLGREAGRCSDAAVETSIPGAAAGEV